MGQALLPLAIGGMAVGTTMSISGQLAAGKEAEKEGKRAQQIANANALVDLENAKLAMQNAQYAREQAVAKTGIVSEEGIKLKAKQKGIFAAGNVKINVGAPVVVEAQTNADIAADMGYILEEGRQQTALYEREADIYKYQVGIERMTGEVLRKRGIAARKQSKWAALATGLQGFGSLAMMGYLATPSGGATTTTSPGVKTTSTYKSMSSSQKTNWLMGGYPRNF
jgi:hypothetical protein